MEAINAGHLVTFDHNAQEQKPEDDIYGQMFWPEMT